MRTNPNYILREIAGEYVLIPTGEAARVFSGMIYLSETAAFVWKQLDENGSTDDIARQMADEFDVTADQAANDINVFLAKLREKGMIVE